MGPDYTLLRFDVSIDLAPLMSAAAEFRIPIALLDVRSDRTPEVYRNKLVLNRPDGHVAWRGDALPLRPAELVALISGREGPDSVAAAHKRPRRAKLIALSG